ncbi:MAG: hypothetical protein V1791_10135 [Pseudomonadota bacterium]
MELSLRIALPFSQTANTFIKALIENHPIIFGSLWIIIIASLVWIAFREYSEKKTNGKLGTLLIWLTILVIVQLSGLCYIFLN